ncbi:MAG: hypothetical protein KAH20_15430 [Methylococcales bacterium]|nr:hypothetical protein [Methylococcales bacterium]
MSNTTTEIDDWLISFGVNESNTNDDIWEPGFEVDRQIVYSKFGSYSKVFLRPENFVKRFYHTVYPLSIEEWKCIDRVDLYEGFCTIDVSLDVRFQATYQYAISNIELLSELNEHIKEAYYAAVLDIVNRELLNLSDGSWIHGGLAPIEKRICSTINEMLILQKIQSQVICKLKPSFEEFPNVQFAKENVYLSVLKKSFEFSEQQKEELFRQQQEEDKQSIEHKRLQLEQLNEKAKVDRQRLALKAENNKLLLKEQEQHQHEQFEIKKRLHAEKVKHSNNLKKMTLLSELEEKETYQVKVREKEELDKIELIAHETKLKEKELEAKIEEFEKEQARWRETKSKIHAEELELKQQQKSLEFDSDVNAKKRFELRRLAMQKESFSVRKKADVYLKRDIELLELEKQQLVLQKTIKEYKNKEGSQEPDLLNR